MVKTLTAKPNVKYICDLESASKSLLLALVASKQPGEQVDWEGEDIGVVVLSRDGVQGLEVSQLQCGR